MPSSRADGERGFWLGSGREEMEIVERWIWCEKGEATATGSARVDWRPGRRGSLHFAASWLSWGVGFRGRRRSRSSLLSDFLLRFVGGSELISGGFGLSFSIASVRCWIVAGAANSCGKRKVMVGVSSQQLLEDEIISLVQVWDDLMRR